MKAGLQRPGLVGRVAELALLHEELESAARGSGRTVVIHGEPGIGKTRLISDFLAIARRKALVFSARAYPLGTTSPFGLIDDALHEHLRSVSPGLLERPDRARVLEELTELLIGLAAEKPVVLALDDIHLADPSTWEAFHHLARHAAGSRLLLVVALRTAELSASPVFSDLVGSLVQDWLARELVLAPLDRSAVWDLARRALAREDIPATLGEWLYTKTLGNPLFVMGFLQAVADTGGDFDTSALSTIPDNLRQRVAARVAALAAPAKAVLEAASVIGERARASEIGAVAGVDTADLPSLLEELVGRRLLVEEETRSGLDYDFIHPLVQEAVYESIGGLRRRRMHLVAARALAGAGRSAGAAAHFARGAEAGDQDAIEFILRVARDSEAKQSHREAVAHLQAAAELALDRSQRTTILDELAWQANLGGDFGAGIPALRELEELMADSPDIAARVRVHLRLASLLSTGSGDFVQAVRAADEAERLAAQAGDPVLQVKALNERSWIVGIVGDIRGQIKLAAGALEKARRLGDSEVLLHVLGSLGHSAAVGGEFELAERSLTEGLEISRSLADQSQIAWHGCQVAWVKAFKGDVEVAMRMDEEIRQEIPDLHHAHLFEFEGFVKWLAGRWEEAAVDSQRTAGSWSAAGMTMREVWALATAVACLAEMGRQQEAAALAARIQRRIGDRRFMWMSDWYGYALGILDLAAGRHEAAQERFADSSRSLVKMGAIALAPFPLLELAAVAAAAADITSTNAAASRLKDLANSLEPPWFAGLAAIAGAEAALAQGLSREAAALADDAVGRLVDSPFQFYAARALEFRGRLRSDTADSAGAIQDLTGALTRYRRLPSPQRAEGVLRRLDDLGAAGRRTAAGVRGASALSPRERSVAVLAAQGMTAREIAEKLFISERTVESHLASAYAKLGLASKRELMRRARDLQLEGRT